MKTGNLWYEDWESGNKDWESGNKDWESGNKDWESGNEAMLIYVPAVKVVRLQCSQC